MAGSALEIDLSQFRGLQASLRKLQRTRTRGLLDVLGAELESQTRRRIDEEKTSPDGEPWPEWSDAYAQTRHGNHELLENEGHLLDSIQYVVDVPDVEVGSNIVYAAAHNDGSGNIPQRQFIGVSDENEADLLERVNDYMRGTLNEAGL